MKKQIIREFFDLKKVVDRAFCEGLNNITFHLLQVVNDSASTNFFP